MLKSQYNELHSIFLSSCWWESSVHHIRKLFNRLLAHYIFTSQAYNPHFSLYWSLKWNLSQLIVYIFSLHCKQIYIFSGNFLLMVEVLFYICDLRKTWSCPDHQLQIKLLYTELIHVYWQKVLSDKGLHWFRKYLYTKTTALTNTLVMILLSLHKQQNVEQNNKLFAFDMYG